MAAIHSLGAYGNLQFSSLQTRNYGLQNTSTGFSNLMQENDSIELSSTANTSSAEGGGLSTEGQKNVDSLATLEQYYDPKTAAVVQRDEVQALTDPRIMVYAQELTASDKQMLGSLQGTGNWASGGTASLLTDEIAASRQNGTLTGNVSTSFIQNIINKQSDASQTEPDAVVPDSVLSAAMQWIQTNASDIHSAFIATSTPNTD